MIDRIRPFIFETNSSLTNALILLDKDAYNKWKEDTNLYINIWNKFSKVYTREEAVSAIMGYDAESDESDDLSESELACEGFLNNDTIYEEGYSIEKLDLDVIGQNYVVVSACKEDR